MPAQRHSRTDFSGFLQRFAVRAGAESLDIDDRPAFEPRLALICAGKRDARFDALLESGGTRRVIAPERNAPDADAVHVDVAARREVVDHGSNRFFIFGADRKLVFGFALSRPVES